MGSYLSSHQQIIALAVPGDHPLRPDAWLVYFGFSLVAWLLGIDMVLGGLGGCSGYVLFGVPWSCLCEPGRVAQLLRVSLGCLAA